MFEHSLAGVLLVALTFYLLSGGADYGAGVLSLTARGPRAREQAALIDQAIAPIWEANHVWLIVIVTVLFTAFPKAFSLISTRLHIPLTVLLIGIVLRGSAFVFRTNAIAHRKCPDDIAQRFWHRIFTGASFVTPVFLGIILGTIASGRLALPTDTFLSSFVVPWLAVFPIIVGLLTLVIVMYLASIYLVVEAPSTELQQDFRNRALLAWVWLVILMPLTFHLAKVRAPEIYAGLTQTGMGRASVALIAMVGVLNAAAIIKRYDRTARLLAVIQTIGTIWGWAVAQ
jgi:cytochrome d ubiquinol oxidase subunit II